MIENRMPPTKIEISVKTIAFTALFLLSLWVLFLIKDIVLLLFVSSLFMATMEPSVKKLERLRLPRWLAIIFIYLFVIAILFITFAGIVPPLIDQSGVLIAHLPEVINQFGLTGIDQNLINSQIAQLGSVSGRILSFAVSIFSNLAAVLVVGVVTFYLLMERKKLSQYLARYFGQGIEQEVIRIVEKVEHRLGDWVRGELTLMTIVGILSFIGFRLLGMEFALPLAIFTGLLEVIPNFGPTVAAIPAILIGLSMSPFHGLAAASWAFLVQQIENNFIVPKVMGKATGLNPLVVILSLATGFRLAGIAGATLAVPVVLAISVIFTELYSKKLR